MNDLFEFDRRKLILGAMGVVLFIFVAINVSNHTSAAADSKKQADAQRARIEAVQEQERMLDRINTTNY
jgi:hypothetical protein